MHFNTNFKLVQLNEIETNFPMLNVDGIHCGLSPTSPIYFRIWRICWNSSSDTKWCFTMDWWPILFASGGRIGWELGINERWL